MNRDRTQRRSQAGFTLVELMVALMAGLIVAMAVLMLSREATNTFHEEARLSAAEATLRTAMDRLRGDLQRAGYMSTGNIWADPTIAVPPGGNVGQIYTSGNENGLTHFGSIYLNQGGSNAKNGLSQSALQTPALSPDAIQITGNMTTSDAFEVLMIVLPGTTLPAGTGAVAGCTRINLIANSPAMYRLFGSAGATTANSTEFQYLFAPSSNLSAQFVVRLVDDMGCSQYLATCKTASAGIDAGGPFVDVDTTDTPIVTASQTGAHCGISNLGTARSWINPVQTVQWEITTAAGSPADTEPPAAISAFSEATGDAGSADGPKYDLMRTYYDMNAKAVPDTSEIVAEYAVDLAFAFTVDSGTSAAPVLQTFPFDNVGSASWGAQPTSTAKLVGTGPQRIRTVRVRLATRTAEPDRTVPVAPTAVTGSSAFLYRYCMPATCPNPAAGTNAWARVRTLATEVSLQNQARSYY